MLPSRVLLDIEQIMRGFLWSQDNTSRGKVKVAWDVVYLPKQEGGLGIRRLDHFNKALMVSHVCKLLSLKESLWVKWNHVYKLKNISFWDIPYRGKMSWSWRKLLLLRSYSRIYLVMFCSELDLINLCFADDLFLFAHGDVNSAKIIRDALDDFKDASAFFKDTWDIIGVDVIKAVKEFFTNGRLLKELNHTIIALIPKVNTPARVTDYRLILCCNVLFKCISKIIANRFGR
nr:putative reverse transcriptase domain, reverse transcriptase zinc-binding domain protein [Tanacetum cinerariifolium]